MWPAAVAPVMAFGWVLWVGLAGIAAAALAVGVLAWRRPLEGPSRTLGVLAIAIPVSAATWYLAMALGQATLDTPAGTVYWGRYADGVLNLPVMVLALGVLAGADRRSIGLGMALAAYSMLATLAATVSTGAAKLAWTGVAVGAFLAVVWIVLVAFGRAAGDRPDRVLQGFRRLRGYIVVLWLAYPALWVLMPGGFALAPRPGLAVPMVLLDLALKAGTGLLLVRSPALAALSSPLGRGRNRGRDPRRSD